MVITIDTNKRLKPIEISFDDDMNLAVMKQGHRLTNVPDINLMQQEVIRFSVAHLLHIAGAHSERLDARLKKFWKNICFRPENVVYYIRVGIEQ